uniref:G-patch domain-containing protein n=1 Tax=Steinernema glaseri TaxID=37863 RepID=A0A1I7ZVT2_9BILA
MLVLSASHALFEYLLYDLLLYWLFPDGQGQVRTMISFGVKAKPKTAAVVNRPGAFTRKHQQVSDSEDEDEVVPTKKQRVDFFEDGAAPKVEEPKEKLVIPIEKKNRGDWIKARLALLNGVGDGEKVQEKSQNGKIEKPAAGEKHDADPDYSQMPIEGFGLAMLRGMGWKDGEGMGKNHNVKVDYKAPTPRPKGLGLGAVPRVENDTSAPKTGLDKAEEKQLGVGSLVKIVGTSNDGAYGKVEGVDEENASVFVALVIAKKTVRVSQYAVQTVSKKEYDKESRYINTLPRSKDIPVTSALDKGTYDEAKVEKKTPNKKASRTSFPPPTTEWVQRGLRVRLIHKKYGERYYKEKMVVLDAPDSRHCMLRDEDGTKHRRMKESWLETVIPRDIGAKVMIVSGRRRGQLAILKKRDKERQRIYVRVIDTKEDVKLSFDEACEWTERH